MASPTPNDSATRRRSRSWQLTGPAARLVEIWNSLPGESPVKKFKDRATAINRIWKAIQNLGGTAPVAEETTLVPEQAPITELPETAQPEGVISTGTRRTGVNESRFTLTIAQRHLRG
jgi:hypothetical protein